MNFKKIGATVGSVALLVVGLSLMTATTASAHTPNASLTCSTASVSLVSYDQGATADITLDGVSEHTGTFGGHLVQTYPTILSSSSTHTLVVHVVSQDGVKYNSDITRTATGCDVVLIPVTVAEASSNPATCDSPATYTLPAQPEGIKYALQSDGTRPAAGTFTLEPGVSITVIAHSIAGYIPASESWTFTGVAQLNDVSCHIKPASLTRNVTTDGVPDCTNLTVSETTTYYETDYVWSDDSHSYVLGTEYVVDTKNSSRAATAEECPPTSTPTPTATPTVIPTTPPTNGPKERVLGFTGDTTSYVVVGSIAVGLLFVGFIILLIKRRTSH